MILSFILNLTWLRLCLFELFDQSNIIMRFFAGCVIGDNFPIMQIDTIVVNIAASSTIPGVIVIEYIGCTIGRRGVFWSENLKPAVHLRLVI